MKRLFVVGGLLALMLGLQELGAPTGQGAGSLTLAATGFVILASFAIAELLVRAGLPKVTGYILSGVALGPYAADVLSTAVVAELRMFNTLALGLIALTAGLELEVGALRAAFRTLAATTLAKLLLAGPLVAGTLIAAELTLGSLGLPSVELTVALGLVFGVLAVGTSPAISLAVTREAGARGRLSELALGAAVLGELVVWAAAALIVGLAEARLTGAPASAAGLQQVGVELGLSIVAGAAVGGLLIAYVRFIRAEMLLFVAALVLVMAELASALQLELLLVGIVAGFVVRNASGYARELLPPLQLVSLPVFVVFFTIAGASVDVAATIAVLPLALALCAARAGGLWLAAAVGNRVGREPEAVRQGAWLTYLPQAGVGLGLAGVAATQVPELAAWATPLAAAVVAINLLIGPLAQRSALARAGELPGAEAAPVGQAPEAPRRGLADPGLEARVAEIYARLGREVEEGVEAAVEPWIALRRRRLAALPAALGPAELEALAYPPPEALKLSRAFAGLFEKSAAELEGLARSVEVPLERRWLAPQPRESWLQALRRTLRRAAIRLGRRAAARRQVPLRLAARASYEPRLVTAMLEVFRASCRCDARVADLLRRVLEGSRAADELPAALAAVLDDFAAAARDLPRGALASGDRALREVADRAGSPGAGGPVDFSEASAAIERELAALTAEAELWPSVSDGCWQAVGAAGLVRQLEEHLAGSRATAEEMRRAGETLGAELTDFGRRLEELRAAAERGPGEGEEGRAELLDALSMRCRGLLPKPAAKRLRQLGPRLRRLAELRGVRQGVRELCAHEAGPRSLASTTLAASAAIPARVRTREVDLAELLDGEVSGRLLPRTQQRIEAASAQIDEGVAAAKTIVVDLELLLEVHRARDPAETEPEALRTGIERLIARGAELQGRVLSELNSLSAAIQEDFEGLARRLDAALEEATLTSEGAHWVSRRAGAARLRFGRSLARLRERGGAAWSDLARRVSAAVSGLSEDYRLRSGQASLSASEIAAMLPAPPAHLPREYVALFGEQPIRDPRLFVANREALRRVSKAEREWIDGSLGNGALVIGGPGSGKSSLLAVAQLRVATRELVWLPLQARGLVAALAAALRCPAREEMVLRRLHDRRRVVVIDDLQRALTPGATAAAEIEWLLGAIAATSTRCFWLVSIERELQQLFEPILSLREAFAAVVELEGPDLDELASTLLARHRLSGKPLQYPREARARRLLARVSPALAGSREQRFFAGLAAASAGNLRAALAEWCRRATLQGEALTLATPARGRGLPFLRQLPVPALGVVVTLLRFGPCRAAELADALAIAPAELGRWLHFLAMSGLVVRGEAETYLCPPRVRDALVPELAAEQVLHGGAA